MCAQECLEAPLGLRRRQCAPPCGFAHSKLSCVRRAARLIPRKVGKRVAAKYLCLLIVERPAQKVAESNPQARQDRHQAQEDRSDDLQSSLRVSLLFAEYVLW